MARKPNPVKRRVPVAPPAQPHRKDKGKGSYRRRPRTPEPAEPDTGAAESTRPPV